MTSFASTTPGTGNAASLGYLKDAQPISTKYFQRAGCSIPLWSNIRSILHIRFESFYSPAIYPGHVTFVPSATGWRRSILPLGPSRPTNEKNSWKCSPRMTYPGASLGRGKGRSRGKKGKGGNSLHNSICILNKQGATSRRRRSRGSGRRRRRANRRRPRPSSPAQRKRRALAVDPDFYFKIASVRIP